jgi:beta-glucanase (GH16 family)
MKRSALLFACLWAAVTLTAAPTPGPEWKLVWADEFDKPGLPDPAKWTYEQGWVRNNEAQYYTRERRENVRVENGMLVIEAIREKFPNPGYKPGADPKSRSGREFSDYTSGSISTKGLHNWRYGRLEARIKIPQGRGMWPAFWMLGNDRTKGWPACGEIDIMEYVGYEPDTIHGTIHCGKYNHVKKTQKGKTVQVKAPYQDFHVYAVEWDARKIDIFVDDQKYFSFANEGTGQEAWPFDVAHYLILNVAVGGAWGGVKGIDESIFPQKMTVDYVRVYQKP